jgi:hypothetical protein
MGTAYTPGLTVTSNTTIRKVRRLPIKGEVFVKEGQEVEPQTLVARALLPGPVTTIRLAERLGVEPNEMKGVMRKGEGDEVKKGDLLAEIKSFFGLFKNNVTSDVDGTIESVSEVTGNIIIRHPPRPVNLTAYIKGMVVEVMPEEGAVIETQGAFVQGIFGVGGERQGALATIATSPQEVVDASRITPEHKDKVIVIGALMTGDVLKAAQQAGVVGVVGGGILDADLRALLGYDIGVAITGSESIGLTLVVTEGFGEIPMAQRTFELLSSLEGETASISGATQIRAGVIRPEVIVPRTARPSDDAHKPKEQILEIGTPIRLIREPYFGLLGKVAALPPEPRVVESGAEVRVLEAELLDGRKVIVPRANVEMIET